MSFEARCIDSFSRQVRGRGRSYVNSVRLDVADEEGASFLVQGSEPKPYEVDLRWRGKSLNSIFASCTCPFYETEGLCKHIWAALLVSDRQGFEQYVRGRQPLIVENSLTD